MTLHDLGYNQQIEKDRQLLGFDVFDIARVSSEHKERYTVKNEKGEFEAELIGNLRFSAQSRSDFPAVGDWVAVTEYDEGKMLIHGLLPRQNSIQRQAVGKHGEKQIIAANLDVAFIVQAVDRDFNVNRIERYLTLCYQSKVEPMVVLNKVDLISQEDLELKIQQICKREEKLVVVGLSNLNKTGFDDLKKHIVKGKTYCLLGSSGVGKSTLINNLSGGVLMETDSISESSQRGRHVTTHRELLVLESGGIFIDNPGMREVGIADAGEGMEVTFDEIYELAKGCRYADCKHINEKGCAVIEAVDSGKFSSAKYENFLKMEREKEHYESTVAEKRQKDKDFGKMVKRFKNLKNQSKR